MQRVDLFNCTAARILAFQVLAAKDTCTRALFASFKISISNSQSHESRLTFQNQLACAADGEMIMNYLAKDVDSD